MHTWNTDVQRGDLYTGTYSHTVAQTGSCCHTEESFRHKYLHRKQQPDPPRNERLCIQRHANADTRFNLGLSGWEMKEGTNLLRWAYLLDVIIHFLPCGRSRLAKWEGNSQLFSTVTISNTFTSTVWQQSGTWASWLFEKSSSCLCTSVNSPKVPCFAFLR